MGIFDFFKKDNSENKKNKDGNEEGLWKEYYEDGQLEKEGNYIGITGYSVCSIMLQLKRKRIERKDNNSKTFPSFIYINDTFIYTFSF